MQWFTECMSYFALRKQFQINIYLEPKARVLSPSTTTVLEFFSPKLKATHLFIEIDRHAWRKYWAIDHNRKSRITEKKVWLHSNPSALLDTLLSKIKYYLAAISFTEPSCFVKLRKF